MAKKPGQSGPKDILGGICMDGEINTKEVRYDIYCEKCKYFKQEDWEDPCNDCLNQPWNVDSRKPIYFKEK